MPIEKKPDAAPKPYRNDDRKQYDHYERRPQRPVYNVLPTSSLREGGCPNNATILVELNLTAALVVADTIDEFELQGDEKILEGLPDKLRRNAERIEDNFDNRLAYRASRSG